MDFLHLLISFIVILLLAKIAGELAERLGQSAVVGEILVGILLGTSCLGWLPVSDFRPGHEGILVLLSEIGVTLLLFRIGLESDVDDLLKVGSSAVLVALIGVISPLILGYAACRLWGLTSIQSLFVGAALTATSVGITARILSDLGRLHTRESKVILGAAIVDDILGLMVLSQVKSIITHGQISLGNVIGSGIIALLFLIISITVGLRVAPYLLHAGERLRSHGWLTTSSLVFCFTMAILAELVGLHPIVGAFAAGLILAKTTHQLMIETRIKPMTEVFVPIFFVIIGSAVNLKSIGINSHHWVFLLMILCLAILSKIMSGLGVVNQGIKRLNVGLGMIPRGEVGLIFASLALSYSNLRPEGLPLYEIIVLVVLITTFLTPFLLKWRLSIQSKAECK